MTEVEIVINNNYTGAGVSSCTLIFRFPLLRRFLRSMIGLLYFVVKMA